MGCIRTLKYRTTEALGNAEVYTGVSFPTELYNQIRGVVSADQSGTLTIEQSYDGTTWIETNSLDVAADTPAGFAYDCVAYFARAVYTNGATPQTEFDLQVYTDPFR